MCVCSTEERGIGGGEKSEDEGNGKAVPRAALDRPIDKMPEFFL